MRRWLAVTILALVGCGGTDYNARVEGDWLYDNGTAGAGLTMKSGAYTFLVLQLTDTATANVQEETGSFDADAAIITFRPQRSSCVGNHPVYADDYTLTGSSLVLTDGSTAVAFVRNTYAPSSVVATYGCFESGTFVAMPIAPVGN